MARSQGLSYDKCTKLCHSNENVMKCFLQLLNDAVVKVGAVWSQRSYKMRINTCRFVANQKRGKKQGNYFLEDLGFSGISKTFRKKKKISYTYIKPCGRALALNCLAMHIACFLQASREIKYHSL